MEGRKYGLSGKEGEGVSGGNSGRAERGQKMGGDNQRISKQVWH